MSTVAFQVDWIDCNTSYWRTRGLYKFVETVETTNASHRTEHNNKQPFKGGPYNPLGNL